MLDASTDCDGESNTHGPTKNVSQLALLTEKCYPKANLQKCLNFNVDTSRSRQVKIMAVGMIAIIIVAFILFYIIVEDEKRGDRYMIK